MRGMRRSQDVNADQPKPSAWQYDADLLAISNSWDLVLVNTDAARSIKRGCSLMILVLSHVDYVSPTPTTLHAHTLQLSM